MAAPLHKRYQDAPAAGLGAGRGDGEVARCGLINVVFVGDLRDNDDPRAAVSGHKDRLVTAPSPRGLTNAPPPEQPLQPVKPGHPRSD